MVGLGTRLGGPGNEARWDWERGKVGLGTRLGGARNKAWWAWERG